jgi:hypothetical protein
MMQGRRGGQQRERERERDERLFLIGRYQYHFTIPFKHAWALGYFLAGGQAQLGHPYAASQPASLGLLPWLRGQRVASSGPKPKGTMYLYIWLQSFFDETLAAHMA